MTAATEIAGPGYGWRGKAWPWALVAAAAIVILVIGALLPREASTKTEQVAAIAGTIRCPTCSGESVAQSDADISKQIRVEIADRLQSGQNPDDIRSYFASRYGDNILLTPQGSGLTGLIWALPVIVLVLAISGLVVVFRRWNRASVLHASDADRALVSDAMSERDG